MADFAEMNEDSGRVIEHYNPVTVTLTETTGIMALSIFALILLFAFLRSQRQIRELQRELFQGETG